MRSLRVRLAVAGFAAIYVPVLLLAGVTAVTEDETTTTVDGEEVVLTDADRGWSPWATVTVVGLAPAAAALAWWWAGRAVRPIDAVRSVAEDIEGTDLGRRIGLDHGPTEVVALAASFDAMLDRLEQAAEAQRRLVDETSHELRTPLAVLVTTTDVLLAHPDPTPEVYRDGLARSKAAALRMQATIDDLLVDARSRVRAIDRRPADVAAMVRSVADDVAPLASTAGVEVVVRAPESMPCDLDEPTVRRAVANLVDNAVRHAPAGSAVSVDVAVVSSSGAAGEVIAIEVTDHGPGIPTDEQARIFERFWGRGGSAGLGLPIARQVARAHGGDVTVASPGPTGDGAVFRLTVRR